jgi:23S rRNA pseudouridine1911/1915/1917 synthase
VSEPDRQLDVHATDAGQRLDRFLADRLQLSRSAVRRLLARGAVSVDEQVVNESAKGQNLLTGSSIAVARFARPEDERALPDSSGSLVVLAEGPGWLAVDKPAGVAVHPLRADETGTLLNALIARCPETHGVGEGGLRSGVVHRIDIDTSGVVLFATHEPVWQRIRAAFAAHDVEKHYRAIVLGHLSGEGSIEVGLVTARHRPARVRVISESEASRARGVWMSAMRWRSLQLLDGATLVEISPRTGFLHQIRVTLAHMGFPVAGDKTYGPQADPTGAPRHMLHAARAKLDEIEATSPDPADFAEQLRRLALAED